MHRKDFLQALGFGSLGAASIALIDHAKWSTEASTGSNSGEINVTSFGATGDGTTNDGPAIQNAINALQSANGGTLYFPHGTYLVTSDVSYNLNSRGLSGGSIKFVGDDMRGTVLHFKGANFNDGNYTDWNTGYTHLTISDMFLRFDGDGSGKGVWTGGCTLLQLDRVRLRVGGEFPGTTSTVVDLGSKPSPAGETFVWNDVAYEPALWIGSNITPLSIRADSFIWNGGSISTFNNTASGAVTNLTLLNLSPVSYGHLASLNMFRGDSTLPMTFATVTITASDGQLIVDRCHFYGNITSHFTHKAGSAPTILVRHSSSGTGGVYVWPLITAGSPLPNMMYENNLMYKTSGGGTASVANGRTIAHGLSGQPTRYRVASTVAGHIVAATSVSPSSLTIGLTDANGAAISSAEEVTWWAEV